MTYRLTVILVTLACISPSHSYSQKIVGDVPVSWIGQRGFRYQCDQHGQFYYETEGRSVVRVNPDGSTLLFEPPDPRDEIAAYTSSNNGLIVLAHFIPRNDEGPSPKYHLYHFDNEAKVVTTHTVSLGFRPAMMTMNSSGKTVIVGYVRILHTKPEDMKLTGAVLDVEDKVSQFFDFPTADEGGNYLAGGIVGGDGVAYEILGTWKPRHAAAIATIAESGRVDVKALQVRRETVPNAQAASTSEWLLGPSVVVEEYSTEGKTPVVMQFDEYDLASAKWLRAKTTPATAFPGGFHVDCYLGDEIVRMVEQHYEDPQSTHRVTIKLDASTSH